ncbi:type-F conjugative transfer system pilin acetylase TraX [Klebsiella pneumoniae]|uniref:Type-F conjugative transfer system pilin acetylase TraX n=1 Tax=Klebsiella pneumoniae TaxID=573 RepID=A0A377XEP9_KLEPN|nr:type-F conjugative transfer system pilin acetylase TraX [Klebsiella pneumoniae]
MIIDHTNTVFLSPALPVMYALGRMAFPLFTLIWAMNVQRTPERLQKRASRLWIWAVITQPVFSLAFWPRRRSAIVSSTVAGTAFSVLLVIFSLPAAGRPCRSVSQAATVARKFFIASKRLRNSRRPCQSLK